ncbi:MAG: GtrA family protein [Hyphomonadaceae bacterium]|nr:GtrA family protein [Hyphomonadaceae bacterium]
MIGRLYSWALATVKARLTPEVLRYALVGGFGFAVDAGVLVLLNSGFGVPPVVSRAISIPVSIVATWYLHRTWTFRYARENKPLKELALYFGVQGAGGLVAFVIYSALVLTIPLMAKWPAMALVVSDAIAFFVNYLGAKYLAFRPAPTDQTK